MPQQRPLSSTMLPAKRPAVWLERDLLGSRCKKIGRGVYIWEEGKWVGEEKEGSVAEMKQLGLMSLNIKKRETLFLNVIDNKLRSEFHYEKCTDIGLTQTSLEA